jgi:hypothetical protein
MRNRPGASRKASHGKYRLINSIGPLLTRLNHSGAISSWLGRHGGIGLSGEAKSLHLRGRFTASRVTPPSAIPAGDFFFPRQPPFPAPALG